MALVHRLRAAVAVGFLAALPLQAQAQTGTIGGRVVDSTSRAPLSNVTVVVQGTSHGAMTRDDGTFTIANVPAGPHTVVARRIGYSADRQTVTVPANGRVDVTLAINSVGVTLTPIVTVGYGTQRREAITGSVSTIDAEAANKGVVTNADQMIQGRTPGVQMVTANGEPGANTQVRIRGGTSISAGNDPLYVIDGVPIQNASATPGAPGVGFNSALDRNPLNSLNPEDIESITVLKDASATAIYGSRAANGVILIQTKRGERQSNMEYGVYVGSSTPTKTLGLASGDQYRAAVNKYSSALGASAVAALGTANTDWEKAVTHTGYAMNHELAFTGGSDQTKYRASLNYFDNEGIVPNSGLKRYQGRLNANHNAFSNRLNLALNLTASRVNNQYSPNENGGGFTGGLFTNMVIMNPTKPIKNADGTYFEIGSGAQDVRNPVAMIYQLWDVAPENRVLGNLTGSLTLVQNLTAQTTVGIDQSDAVRQSYSPRNSPIGAAYSGYARQAERHLQNQTFQQLLTYTPAIGADRELEVVGGYEYVKDDNKEYGAAAQNFITDAYGVDNLNAGGTIPTGYPYSWHSEDALSSFFGRANFGFQHKYFLTGVLRKDGSSRLAPGHQWETFPGISGSWRISEEDFMKSDPLGLSTLALRLGWGKQGNQAIQPYQTQLLLKSDNGSLYPFGGVCCTAGLSAVQVGNPNLKWETANQVNLGIDYGFKNDKITGAIDIYQKNTSDLLLDRAVPQPAVVSSRIENVGSLRNRGVEGSMDMQLWNSGRKSLTGGLVLTVERNQVTSLGDSSGVCSQSATTSSFAAYSAAKCTFIESGWVQGQGQSGQWSQIIMVGQPLGTFLAPKFMGVVNGRQTFYCTAATAGCTNGTTQNPSDADRQFIGSANPSFTAGLRNGLTWGNVDASWLWRGEFGGKVFDNTALVYQTKSALSQGRNFLSDALADPDSLNEPAKFSDRWIYNRTFVRLQNLTVGYTLPATMTAGHVARFYVSGDNVLLFSGYKGYDPEVFTALGTASRGIDYLTYPPTRRFTIGARTQF